MKNLPWWNVATSKAQAASGLFVVDSLGIAWAVDALQIAWTVKACRWLEHKQAVWHEETELIISMSGQSTQLPRMPKAEVSAQGGLLTGICLKHLAAAFQDRINGPYWIRQPHQTLLAPRVVFKSHFCSCFQALVLCFCKIERLCFAVKYTNKHVSPMWFNSAPKAFQVQCSVIHNCAHVPATHPRHCWY